MSTEVIKPTFDIWPFFILDGTGVFWLNRAEYKSLIVSTVSVNWYWPLNWIHEPEPDFSHDNGSQIFTITDPASCLKTMLREITRDQSVSRLIDSEWCLLPLLLIVSLFKWDRPTRCIWGRLSRNHTFSIPNITYILSHDNVCQYTKPGPIFWTNPFSPP